jgi:DNA repair photolyase
MIISASRRTDIPAFFAEWFVNRIRVGYVYTRNPINPHQISKISLSPDAVDCIVFWTKNHANLLPYLKELAGYNFYFQFTITPYGQELEPGLPPKPFLLELFKELSHKLGHNRVIWRYDPIIISETMPVAFHVDAFSAMAASLQGYTKRCVISFIDMYKKCERNLRDAELLPISEEIMREIATAFAKIAARNKIELVTCAEEIDLSAYGIAHGKCIDDHGYEIQSKLRGIIPYAARDCSTNQSHSAAHTELEFHNKLITEISGRSLKIGKDKTQRPLCQCVTSIDIGAYNTCLHGCLYCYANSDIKTIKKNIAMHDPLSPLLNGTLGKDDIVTTKKAASGTMD